MVGILLLPVLLKALGGYLLLLVLLKAFFGRQFSWWKVIFFFVFLSFGSFG